MLYLESPDAAPAAAASRAGVEGELATDALDLIETRLGTLAIRPASGAWAYLDRAEASIARALLAWPTSIDELCLLTGLGSPALREVTDAMWRRGLLARGRVWSADLDAERRARDAQATQVFALAMVLSSGCNLACKYCYLGHEDPKSWVHLKKEDALRAVTYAFDRGAPMTAIDLGEVTVAGRTWREIAAAVDAMGRSRGQAFQIQIQTNGTTLDDDDMRFLVEHQISVGVSLDGPEKIQNMARPFRAGHGTHARVIRTLEQLAAYEVPHWVISTIGRHNASEPEALLDHLMQIDARAFVLKPVLPFGEADGTWTELGLSSDEYAAFLRRAIRHGLDRSPTRIDLTTRQYLLRAVQSPSGWMKSCISRRCGCGDTRLVIEADGRFTPCPRFGEYAAPVGAPPQRISLPIWSRQLPASCKACAWQTSCGGGCALSGAEDPHCASYRANFEMLFTDVIPALVERQECGPLVIART